MKLRKLFIYLIMDMTGIFYKVSYSNINAIYSKRSWNFIDRNSIKDDKIIIKNAKKKVQMYD